MAGAVTVMKTIADVIDDILRREGGYANRVADRGGPTNKGITARSWGEYRKLGRSATIAEVQAITDADARQFYWDVFVQPLVAVPEPLRSLLVDWSVTSGPREPIRALQAALVLRDRYLGPIDGLLGPVTLAAIGREVDVLYYAVLKARVEFYQRLAFDIHVREFLMEHPESQLHNLRGWIGRALEFMA